jgi:two-component system NarL family response regulator
MSKQKRLRILIADDHPIVRRGLAALIEDQEDMELVAAASTGTEAVALYRRHRPDVTLLDLRMPELDGVGVIQMIRAHDPQARIIVLTTYDTAEDIHRALQAGAAAYALKDMPAEELIETIWAVRAGQTRLPPEIAAKVVTHLSAPALSLREVEVLQLLALGKSNRAIAASLFLSVDTIKTHITHILHKLGVNDRTQAVTVALKRGLVRL